MTTRIEPMRIYHEASKQSGEQVEAYYEYRAWVKANHLTDVVATNWKRHIEMVSEVVGLRVLNAAQQFAQMS